MMWVLNQVLNLLTGILDRAAAFTLDCCDSIPAHVSTGGNVVVV